MTKAHEDKKGLAGRAPWDFDRTQKPADEAEYFASFRYLEPDVYGSDAVHADCPDFRITLSGRIVGVEIMKLCKANARQDIESTQEKILNYALKYSIEIGHPPADVTLFPNFRQTPKDASRRKIADAVVQVVRDNMPANGANVALDMCPGQPSEVDLIIVHRREEWASGRWHWSEAAKVEKEVVRIAQNGIDKKASLLSAYLKSCDECWLLLVADGLRPSGKFDFGSRFRAHMFASPFARTYVLDFAKANLLRLVTAAGTK